MRVSSIAKIISFLIIFQCFNKGFMPIPKLDLRGLILILIGLATFFYWIDSLLKGRRLNTTKLILLFINYFFLFFCIVTWIINPISDIEYFARRALQLVYLTGIIHFFICFSNYIKLKRCFSFIQVATIFLAMSVILQGVGIDLTELTFYERGKSTLPIVKWLPTDIQRLSGFDFDPNIAGIHLGTGALIIWIHNHNKLVKLTLFLLVASCLVLTFSRGVYLSALVTGLSAFSLATQRYQRQVLLMGVLATVIILGSLLALEFNEFLLQLDSSNRARINFWIMGLTGFLQNIIFGVGFSNINQYLANNGMWFTSVHNSYLHILSEVGLIGFFIVSSLFRIAYIETKNILGLDKQLKILLTYVFCVLFFISEHMDPTIYILSCVLINEAYRTCPRTKSFMGIKLQWTRRNRETSSGVGN